MPRLIGAPVTNTTQLQREIFRLEIEVGGTQADPFYVLKGHATYAKRDTTSGTQVGSVGKTVSIVIPHASLPPALVTGITNLIARLDTIVLPEDSES